MQLVLEVRLNGQRSPMLWEFDHLEDGSLATSAERLRLLGFDIARLRIAPDAQVVRLSDLPGVSYHYAEDTQSVEIDAPDDTLVPVVLDAALAPQPIDIARLESHLGAILSYGLFVAGSSEGFQASGQYDARVMTGAGVFSTSGYADYSADSPDHFHHVRLDTNWRYVDARHVLAFEAGDVIGDGGNLGVLYRLGGIQVRRDYGRRPDIVTTALPILNATAAVPSMIDLYVNGLHYFNGTVGRGPFQFRSLPNLGSGATATIVMTDAAGRETRIEKPIFYEPSLLPRGMFDFSAEAGFPRLNYGAKSFDYLHEPAASGSIGYGITDWLTGAAHVEAMRGFFNGSLGAIVRVGGIGSISAKVAASNFLHHTDARFNLSATARIAGINLYGVIERTHSGYQDLLSVISLRAGFGLTDTLPHPVPTAPPILLDFSRRTERAGASFTLLGTGVGLNYTHVALPGQGVNLASASLSRSLFGRVSVWANAYRDFGTRDDYGVFFGFSLGLGKRVSLSSNVSTNNDGTMLTTRASRNPDGTPGSWGWSVTDSETLSGRGNTYRGATVRYLGRSATLEGGIEQQGGAVRVTGYAEGSVVAMGGGVFLAPRVDDSFAIVRGAGADTPVMENTRTVARTNSAGRALVPYIPSYQQSTIAIDPVNLPVDLRPARTEAIVVPADRAGVIVDFGVAPIPAAIVILVDATGKPLPLGSLVTLEGGDGEPVVVGYDGRTYVTGLGAANRVHVEREGAPTCSASFDFHPVAGQQVQIGPLTCQ